MKLVKVTRNLVRFEEEGTRNFMYIAHEAWWALGSPKYIWVEVTVDSD